MKKFLSFALCSALVCGNYTPVKSNELTNQGNGLNAYITNDTLKLGFQMCFWSIAAYFIYQAVVKSANNNRSQTFKPGSISESFASVAGNEEAKAELMDIVDYLQDPTKFKDIGANVPKGVLLTGPSGTGKTLLARALAGEANCSFIAVSGSSFDEMYVGVGASRIRELFAAARAVNGPCIIFIDEIDALIPSRTNMGGGSAEFKAQTINEFLNQVDGFAAHKHPIIIIGATNRIETLDEAALRPGRFDRIVEVGLPNVDDREKILQLHIQGVKHSSLIRLRSIAERTEGFAGAHLAYIINESALIALKQKRTSVTQHDVEAALNKLIQRTRIAKRA